MRGFNFTEFEERLEKARQLMQEKKFEITSVVKIAQNI